MSVTSLSMPCSFFIFRNAKTKEHWYLEMLTAWAETWTLTRIKSRVSLGGQTFGGLTTVAGEVKSRRESVKAKNLSQGSKETSNLEYFH